MINDHLTGFLPPPPCRLSCIATVPSPYPASTQPQGLVLLQFLLLSVNMSISQTHYVWLCPYLVTITSLWMCTLTWPVWGQRSHRVTQGQKCHFHHKCYYLLQITWYCMVMELIHSLDTLYKSYGSRNSPWGHRSQKVIFTKNVISGWMDEYYSMFWALYNLNGRSGCYARSMINH